MKAKFNGRLHAKWAIFYEFLGLDYEAARPVMGSDAYQPAFKVEGQAIDVSGRPPSDEKLKMIASYERAVYVFTGISIPSTFEQGARLVTTDSEGQTISKGHYLWAECPYCGQISLTRHDSPALFCGCRRDFTKYSDKYGLFYTPSLIGAYSSANKAKLAMQGDAVVGYTY